MPIQIVKKDKSLQNFNPNKIVDAIRKSADRACVKLTQKQEAAVVDYVCKFLIEHGQEEIEVAKLHNIVENALDEVDPKVAKCYRDYRNYKTNFFAMIDKVYQKKLSLSFIADRSNANADSALVTTQKAIVYNELNTEFYKKFFLNEEERKASDEGFIYIHDKNARLDTINCCVYDMEGLMKSGFKMGNLEYGEPKTLDVAFDLMCDVAMNASSAQYGGFTIPEVDKLLGYYAEKSYSRYNDEYRHICDDLGVTVDSNKADEYAYNKVKRDVEQGVQGMEMKFNSVASSRGDYPFTAVTFGLGTKRLETLISSTFLKVRKEGQGKEGFKRPVLFPKLSFFYDEELHGEGKELEWLFEEAIDCSSKTMYPDFISLSGDGYAPTMYKKYKTPISRMGCVEKYETISIRMKDCCVETSSFDDIWDLLSHKYIVKNQTDLGYTSGQYIDLDGVEILDVNNKWVKCNRIIRNEPSNDWYIVRFYDKSIKLRCTADHVWTVSRKNDTDHKLVVSTLELQEDDVVEVQPDDNSNNSSFAKIRSIEKLNGYVAESYDVTTESEHFLCSGIRSHNCRASLATWYRDGGMHPKDDDDVPIYTGRFNMGAIALNFPMYVAKAKDECKDFYEVLDYYLELVRRLSQKTIEFLSHKKAGINPLGFCEGGFIGGNKDPEDELGIEFLKPMTISFGIIALNEASVLATGKSIAEDDTWAFEVMQYINKYVDRIKEEDDTLYAIYGVPGETAVCTLRDCFVKKYGVIKGVSDKPYFTNSFHCAVYEDITPIHKQDSEYRCFHLTNGGNIQYCRYPVGYNKDAIRALVKRAMEKGYYEGVNMELNFCNECGHQWVEGDVCPKCGTGNIVQIQRMNGYLGYSKIGKDKSYFNEGKMAEFKDRISM